MAINPGVAPLDPTTPVGQVRLNLGDTEYVPLDPAVEGQGSYNSFSDAAIEAFLTAGRDSVLRATGRAVHQLALFAAMEESRSIKTDDLSIGESKRAHNLRLLAQDWFDRADADDAENSLGLFDVIPFVSERRPFCF